MPCGLVLGVLALEGVLALLAIAFAPEARPTLPPRPVAAAGGSMRRILCIGDSNTYGVHLDEHESYPAQLGVLLANAPGGPWSVQNVGFPGRNSAEARYLLVEQLATHRPDIVIAWVGMNNTWSRAMGHLWKLPDREEPRPSARAFESLRTVRLARILLQRPVRRAFEDVAMLEDIGGTRIDGELARADVVLRGADAHEEFRRRLRTDLARIRALCDAAGARLLLVDYPYEVSHARELINPTIRAFAEETGTALLSLDDEIRERLPAFGMTRMLFADYHFRRDGNGEVARLVANACVREGWIERGEWLDVPALEDRLSHARIDVERTGEGTRATVRGIPRGAARILVDVLVERPGGRVVALAEIVGGAGAPGVRALVEIRSFDDEGAATAELVLPEPPADLETVVGPGTRFAGWRVLARVQLEDDVGTAIAFLGNGREPVPGAPREVVVGRQ